MLFWKEVGDMNGEKPINLHQNKTQKPVLEEVDVCQYLKEYFDDMRNKDTEERVTVIM